MRKLFLFVFIVGFSLIYADGLINAAMNNDYKKFEKLVNKEEDLNETNEKGMNIQLSLAYFSDDNFEKACNLLSSYNFDFDKPTNSGLTLLYDLAYSLSYNKIQTLVEYNIDINKKVQNLYPIQATQFSTYTFVSNQIINPDNEEKTKKITKLLVSKGSEPYSYFKPTLYQVGNFVYCNAYIIYQSNRLIKPQYLNQEKYFEFTTLNERYIASVRYDILPEMYSDYSVNAEFCSYTDFNMIKSKLQECSKSKDKYFVMINTGNNKIAPYQWVFLSSLNKRSFNDNDYFECINSDSLFECVKFQIKDISQIITVKVNN